MPGDLVGSLAVDIDCDNKNIIWIGTGLKTPGITKFDGQNWTYFDSSFFGFSFSAVSISIDTKKNLWIGTNKGLLKFYNNIWTIFDTSNSDIPTNFALYLHITKGDTILIGSPAYGKWYFEFDGFSNWKIIDPKMFPS
ncbi:hypothetical protein FBQ84_05680 [Ignavibacteria bacterium CHB1]|nr:hypothetical protein [Ignavibacteria bacterium CHB1]